MITVLGADPMAAGAFLPGALARHLAARLGADRVVVLGLGLGLGLGLKILGVAALVLVLRAGAPMPALVGFLVLYGLGLGLTSTQLTSTVLRDIPSAASGQGSATQSTVRQLGSGFGTAIAGSVLAVVTTHAATTKLEAQSLRGINAADWAQKLSDSTGGLIPLVLHAHGGAAFGEHSSQVAALCQRPSPAAWRQPWAPPRSA